MPEQCVPLWEKPTLRAVAGETLRPGGFAVTDRAAELIGVIPGWRVLDVGSGLGATVGRLRSRFGADALGVEHSRAQIDRSSEAHVVQARGDLLPFRNEEFNAIFCECVLSLFVEPRQGLVEFCRVLQPQGYLVLADLHAEERGLPNGNSCVGRAVPLSVTREQVEACGFTVRLVEDHSRQLKDLAAKLMFAGGQTTGACTGRLGYYLMIAQKGGEPHVG
nr:class I SAM-dependent methyltransferase [uncultured Pseudodesulfovibrio sp.]